MERTTVFSPCRKWRYTLWRDWAWQISGLNGHHHFTEDPHFDYFPGKPHQFVQFIGLNPSTADETKNDPTVRRCVNFAKAWGFGAMCMTNIFAWRSTDPAALYRQHDPIGPENDRWLKDVAAEATLVVCCWSNHGSLGGRSAQVKRLLESIDLHCFKMSQQGQPWHPLYLPGNIQPMKMPAYP